MNTVVVALVGISGVGKTTFLHRLAEHTAFQHLTGGSLIVEARGVRRDERDKLRFDDLDENQNLLVQGFELARDPEARTIVLDGHVVIESGDGLEELPVEVFRAVGITKLFHLEADVAQINANRAGDCTRQRPDQNLATLSEHQRASREHARFIAEVLNIDFHIVKHGDVERCRGLLGGVDDA
ncbi:MAG: AAA family ATPase [Pseudomonadota bacterium]